MLDKEAKNCKEKETLKYRHQTPVYRKQNYRRNPIFLKTTIVFGEKEQYQAIVNIVTQSETARKRS